MLLEGIASNVRRHQESVRQDDGQVSTCLICSFRLSDRRGCTEVRIDFGTDVYVSDGDKVTVSGPVKGGVVRPRAYFNHKTSVGGNRPWKMTLLGTLFGGVVMLPFIAGKLLLSSPFPPSWILGAAGGGALITLYFFYDCWATWSAVNDVRR